MTLSSFVGVLRVGVKNRRHVKWILIIKELGAGGGVHACSPNTRKQRQRDSCGKPGHIIQRKGKQKQSLLFGLSFGGAK